MAKVNYDFGGWATKFDVKCSDGRTIKKGAFAHCDGKTVPLVYNHDHNNVSNVLGHALLENRDNGVYAYCSFNDSENAKDAKEMVKHRDICALSIYANKLQQDGGDVVHGTIREVSLVLAGANPGAFIDDVMMHNDGSIDEAIVYHDAEENELELEVEHGCCGKKDKKVEHAKDPEAAPGEPADAAKAAEAPKAEPKKENIDEKKETVLDVFNTLTEKQQAVVYAIIGEAIAESKNTEVKKDMKQNAFEGQENVQTNENVLSHSDLVEIVKNAKKCGSLRDAFTNACENKGVNPDEILHSVTNISNLYPEYHNVTPTPKKIDREQDWVSKVIGGVKHVPFSRIKSTNMDITADAARAKGYVKANQKVEEVIVAAKRTTDPQTVYKLQKLDRDDVLDITDFDVVMWIKNEMRGKLNEELARAILVGDGRLSSSNDKISEDHIRSIANDTNVYSIAATVGTTTSTDAEDASAMIDLCVEKLEDYKGSGNLTLFLRRNVLSKMLLLKDVNGRRIYKDIKELATAMLVNEIVPVPTNVMGTVMGIEVDLSDYNVGADKGGKVDFFEDFDIDYNKEKYLIETRCSGANVQPYSAIVYKKATV